MDHDITFVIIDVQMDINDNASRFPFNRYPLKCSLIIRLIIQKQT